jgi:predicted GNAT superfamily acetyltransferase
VTGNQNASRADEIVVREIDGPAEVRAVEQLQREVWKIPDLDVVPFTQLVAARAAGGVLLGAFDRETLIGFVYGFVGYERGHTTHHSHMLAVRPAYRNLNIGYKLKHAQREFVLAQGITEITWTFDPLQSLNAYLNFSRLGVISDRYLIDFYGTDAASDLHQNGTDRLWVTWMLASERVTERLANTAADIELGRVAPLVELSKNNAPVADDIDFEDAEDYASIEIPTHMLNIEQQDRELATAWRSATRAAFTAAFAAGFVAVEFIRGRASGKYILHRKREVGPSR